MKPYVPIILGAALAAMPQAVSAQPFTPGHQLQKAWTCGGDTVVRQVLSAKDWVKWIRKNPGPRSWAIAVCNFAGDYHGTQKLPKWQVLDLMRLQRAVGAVTTAADYTAYAEIAYANREWGEVIAVLSEAIGKGLLPPTDPARMEMMQMASSQRAQERIWMATADKQDNPNERGFRADYHLANGAPAKAAALYAQALDGAGKLRSRYQIRMGIARYLAGQKTEAIHSFARVPVNDTEREITDFWLGFLNPPL